MEKLIPDVYEKIQVTLDVKNLIRCKSVCKSWKFLISDPHFIKAHLNHSYSNKVNGHSTIHGAVFPCCITPSSLIKDDRIYYILGSSNGLVCIQNFCSDETLVINPATREEKMLPKSGLLHENVYETCWGFGYDSVTDDYKVVLGVINHEKKTCFQVLSLKSNVWKLIGQVNYMFFCNQRVGILCNGALHWAMYKPNQDTRAVILSLDLSKEEFKEIPQPFDANNRILVGIMEECLCIFGVDLSTENKYNIWVMQKYNVNQSWKMMERNCSVMLQYVGRLTELENNVPNGRSTRKKTWFFKNRKFMDVPNTIVESIVSPHL